MPALIVTITDTTVVGSASPFGRAVPAHCYRIRSALAVRHPARSPRVGTVCFHGSRPRLGPLYSFGRFYFGTSFAGAGPRGRPSVVASFTPRVVRALSDCSGATTAGLPGSGDPPPLPVPGMFGLTPRAPTCFEDRIPGTGQSLSAAREPRVAGRLGSWRYWGPK